jgi:hypothetical protein
MKITFFWGKAPCNLALMMKAVYSSQTFVYFNEITRQYVPQSCQFRMQTELTIDNLDTSHTNILSSCEISSSHGGEYEETQNLLGGTAVFLIECRPTCTYL